jgi:hypothetical protein
MIADMHVTELSEPDSSNPRDGLAQSELSRRRHEAAVLIPSGPPLGQWVFKLVTAELRGHNVPGAEAVKQGIEAVRQTDPDFEPQYEPQLLEQ